MKGAFLPSTVWFSQRTAHSLAGASAGWLLSSLTPAPLINGLLPALSASTTLLPLHPRARFGLGLQLTGMLLLLAVALKQLGPSPFWPLLASGLVGVGRTASLLPMQRWLLGPHRLNRAMLRRWGDAGGLVGSLLVALLYPLLRTTAPQFAAAALLLFPALLLVSSSRWRPEEGSPPPPPSTATGIDRRGGFQGLLFGALFALLPLWVRTIGGGDCVDFGLVLAAYGLGRILSFSLPLPGWGSYAAMAVLLQATSWLPAWGSTALFVPLGALAAGSDAHLADSISAGADAAEGLVTIDRSLAIGSLAGSLAMGAGAQVLGLENARILIVGAFLLAAVLLPRRPAAAA